MEFELEKEFSDGVERAERKLRISWYATPTCAKIKKYPEYCDSIKKMVRDEVRGPNARKKWKLRKNLLLKLQVATQRRAKLA